MSAPERDPGLQPERTSLAWQRSALSLAVATVVVTRLTVSFAGPWAVLVLVLGGAQCVGLFVAARRRYVSRVGGPTTKAWPVGVHAALLAVQVVALAVLELVGISRTW